MLDDLRDELGLAGLTTRASDDYGITVLELWAVVADVLTFHQSASPTKRSFARRSNATQCCGWRGCSITSCGLAWLPRHGCRSPSIPTSCLASDQPRAFRWA
jgi:hypothetical protein